MLLISYSDATFAACEGQFEVEERELVEHDGHEVGRFLVRNRKWSTDQQEKFTAAAGSFFSEVADIAVSNAGTSPVTPAQVHRCLFYFLGTHFSHRSRMPCPAQLLFYLKMAIKRPRCMFLQLMCGEFHLTRKKTMQAADQRSRARVLFELRLLS
jgi:hypothetical protein